MIDLYKEPECRGLSGKQILDADNYVQNAHYAVGFASRCCDNSGVLQTSEALRLAAELCAYMRLLKEGKAE